MSNYMTFEMENQTMDNPRTGQNPGQQGQGKPTTQNPNRPNEGEDESESG